MRLPLFQIDAFADRPFAGNPAAVVILQEWLPDALMQAIAIENNLAETAFLVKETGGWHIRWFTPELEIDLCGHATLASAYVVFNELREPGERLEFDSMSGPLRVERRGDALVLDFPSRPPVPCEPPEGLFAALGMTPRPIAKARDHFLVMDSEAEVAALRPDFAALDKVDSFGMIVTAPGDKVDFVSRFFTPAAGIPEDPVTGSAHCTLIPYWAERLGKTRLSARQISRRGGDLECELCGDRVRIGGRAVKVLQGEFLLPD
jgi:PhzF family phenazine biosynthesis protein